MAAVLEELGSGADALVTHSEDELHEVLRSAAALGKRVVLVGGDGTLHAAANAPLRELPELALVPAGRANNVARALGIPTNRVGALSVAAQMPARPLDALRVATPDRFALCDRGGERRLPGGGARVLRRPTTRRTCARACVRSAARCAATAPYRARVDLDTGQLRSGDAAQLFFSNLPFFGFGFEVDPGADPADGRFDAILLEARSRRRLLRLLAAARRGRHLGRPGVRRVAATRARIVEALPLVADAVPLGTTTATVSVEPRPPARGAPLGSGGDRAGIARAVRRRPAPRCARRACAWALAPAARVLARGGRGGRRPRAHHHLSAGAARADRGLAVADRRGDDRQRDRRLRRADRGRHLVRSPRAGRLPLHRRRGGADRRRPRGGRPRQRAPPTSRSGWRPRSSTSA